MGVQKEEVFGCSLRGRNQKKGDLPAREGKNHMQSQFASSVEEGGVGIIAFEEGTKTGRCQIKKPKEKKTWPEIAGKGGRRVVLRKGRGGEWICKEGGRGKEEPFSS